jgi:hypothetical protein
MNTLGTTTTPIGASSAPEQLTLLSSPTVPAPIVPAQFRLDERTRRSGLEHVAVLRAQIAAQAASRNGTVTRIRPPARQIAA